MPNLSVKLDETMRQRLHDVAAQEGVTPHALMVRAISHELDRAEAEGAFLTRALQARQQVEASGTAIEGPAFAKYLRARVRGGAAQRPAPQEIAKRADAKESDA
jgi:hypothetical protein